MIEPLINLYSPVLNQERININHEKTTLDDWSTAPKLRRLPREDHEPQVSIGVTMALGSQQCSHKLRNGECLIMVHD